MLGFADRTNEFTSANIFTLLEYKRQTRAAKGLPVYNLSVGTPDFPPAPHVIEATREAAADPELYKYALIDTQPLKAAVRDWYARRYGVALEPDEMMSVAGSQEGIAHIALALLNPGDVMLAPNPGYPIFELGPRIVGGRSHYYSLLEENGYLPDFDEIERTMPKNTRVMIASYPSNPVCAVANREFYEELAAFGRKHEIWIIHDNAYSEIAYDGHVGGSFLSAEGAKDIGVEFCSLSKTYNLTGTRISFLLGNARLLDRFDSLRSQFDYGLCKIFQQTAIAALSGPQDAVLAQRQQYQMRRDALCQGLRRIGWDIPDSKGTMFVWGKIPNGYQDDEEFIADLIDRTGVIAIPGSTFGSLGRGHLRFALTMPVAGINAAVDAIDRSGILRHAGR